MNEHSKSIKEISADQEFNIAAYYVVMFLVDHFRTIKKELSIDYESFIILQVVNSHYLYNKKKEKLTWKDVWQKIGDNDAKNTLEKRKLSILAISQILKLPQETSRRKIQNLIKKKILKKDKYSGIIFGEEFVNFHKNYSGKFAHQVAKFVLSLKSVDREFFENILKIKL